MVTIGSADLESKKSLPVYGYVYDETDKIHITEYKEFSSFKTQICRKALCGETHNFRQWSNVQFNTLQLIKKIHHTNNVCEECVSKLALEKL